MLSLSLSLSLLSWRWLPFLCSPSRRVVRRKRSLHSQLHPSPSFSFYYFVLCPFPINFLFLFFFLRKLRRRIFYFVVLFVALPQSLPLRRCPPRSSQKHICFLLISFFFCVSDIFFLRFFFLWSVRRTVKYCAACLFQLPPHSRPTHTLFLLSTSLTISQYRAVSLSLLRQVFLWISFSGRDERSACASLSLPKR